MYFVNSPYSLRLDKPKQKVRPGSLNRVFKSGLSVTRFDYCQKEEMAATAAQFQKASDPYSGVVGW